MIEKPLMLLLSTVLIVSAQTELLAQEAIIGSSDHPGNVIKYDGARDPTSVPLHIALEHFIQSYRGQLDGEFSKSDYVRTLDAVRKAAWLEGLNTALAPIFRQGTVCQQFGAGVHPVAIAQEVDKFDEAMLRRTQVAMEEYYESLSDAGKEAVSSYLDSFVIPKISRSNLQSLAEVVRHEPDWYWNKLKDECSGKPPLKGEFVEKRTVTHRGSSGEESLIRHVVK